METEQDEQIVCKVVPKPTRKIYGNSETDPKAKSLVI